MSERLWRQLGVWLDEQHPVVVATVLAARGATPRRVGSRMLIRADASAFSVGGGLAEARVIAAAQELLAQGGVRAELAIDLHGHAHSAGVCGGQMQIGLRRFTGADRDAIGALVTTLAAGRRALLPGTDSDSAAATWLEPDPRLLIAGAGHCGLALYRAAEALDFDRWVHDTRPSCFADGAFADAVCLCGDAALLARAFDSERAVYVVLLNRDYAADLAVLRAIAGRPLAYLGMMGSQRRIAEVRSQLASDGVHWPEPHAPIGIEIHAETPAEIAISIAAELIAVRRADRQGRRAQ